MNQNMPGIAYCHARNTTDVKKKPGTDLKGLPLAKGSSPKTVMAEIN